MKREQVTFASSCALALALASGPSLLWASEGHLTLEASVYEGQVVERCPLVVRIVVRNPNAETVQTIFRPTDTPTLVRQSCLVVRDAQGRVFRPLPQVGGPSASMEAPVGDLSFPGLATLQVDRVFALVIRTPAPRGWAGSPRQLDKFLAPGKYSGKVQVALHGAEKLVSDEFEFEIIEAQQPDARDLIQRCHVGFLEGRDPPSGELAYSGGKVRDGADLARFHDVQRILEAYPESDYAEWIRFWKLRYALGLRRHYGDSILERCEQAIAYADAHPDFCLSDNLKLAAAKALFASKHFDRCREVVAELVRDYSEGDTRERVLELRDRLAKKP